MRAFLLALTLLLVPMALAQGEVVAQVGPEAITREAFELRYGLFVRSALAQLGLPDTEEARALLAAYRPAFLEALAREKALLQRARKEGLYPDPAAVEARVHALKEAFPEEEALEEALRQAGVPGLEAYRRLVAEAMALEALEARYRSRLAVSRAALKALWLLSPEYRHPTLYCARHLLVPTREEAEEARLRLARGEAFAEVARAVSQDPGSKEEGGDLGCAPEGTYVPAFEEALVRLRPGEVSGPVRTEFGYHLIRLERVVPPGRYPLEEAAPLLEKEVADRAWERLEEALVRAVPVRLYPERLEAEE